MFDRNSGGNLKLSLCFLLILQILAGFVYIKIKLVNPFVVSAFCFVLMLFLFQTGKENINSKEKDSVINILKASLLATICSINFFALRYVLNNNKSLFLVFITASFSAVIILSFLKSKAWSKFWVNVKKAKGLSFDLSKDKDTKHKNSVDIVLCKDKETDEDILIPGKDRFLHLIILGPTGCGKTSQMLLPMCLQDIQNHDVGVTVLDPKSDFAEQVYALAKLNKREALFFDPVAKDCPKFNPLYGAEADVITNITTTFNKLADSKNQYFADIATELLTKSLKVLKRTEGNKATLITLSNFINNIGGFGRQKINELSRKPCRSDFEEQENREICQWFNNEYFMRDSKIFENTNGCRSQLAKLLDNSYIRRVLNPEDGKSEIDFVDALASRKVIAMTTCQGNLGELSRYLGYFLIFQFQAAVFKRPGREETRVPHILYIDEFQAYSSPQFADMLTQGRSYRVSSVLATQSRDMIAQGAGKDGKAFLSAVSTNCRNVVLFPGINTDDAVYYSKTFGTYETERVSSGESKRQSGFFGSAPGKTVSQTVTMVEKPYFSPSEITQRPFGEVVFRIINHNSQELARVGVCEYIPSQIKEIVDRMVDDYREEHGVLRDENGEEIDIPAVKMGDILILDDLEENQEENTSLDVSLPPSVTPDNAPKAPKEAKIKKTEPPEEVVSEILDSVPEEKEDSEVGYLDFKSRPVNPLSDLLPDDLEDDVI